MNFNLSTQEDSAVLSIAGELDALSVLDLRPVINRIEEDQPSKALFKRVKAYDGSLAVVGVQDQPLAILRLLRLDRVLTRASS
jgi:anti-anti-sigma regulatory factor